MLFATSKFEEGSLAITLTGTFHDEFTQDTFGRFGKWLEKDVRNWAHTDVICGSLLSPLIKRCVVNLADFASWRESPSLWRRRAVPVAMVEFLGIQEDYKPLLDFINPMMMDKKVMVQKGLRIFPARGLEETARCGGGGIPAHLERHGSAGYLSIRDRKNEQGGKGPVQEGEEVILPGIIPLSPASFP